MKCERAGGDGPSPNLNGASGRNGGPRSWAERLAGDLAGAVGRSVNGSDKAAVAFSGGVDSSLVALLAARTGLPLKLYTVGLAGAPDLETSARAARALGLRDRLVVLELSAGEVLEAAGRIKALIPDATLLQVSFLAPSLLVFERAPERRILTGDGADELFGGYHRYLSMGPAALAASLEKDARELVSGGFERNRRLAASADKELSAPYLDAEVVELARLIPPQLKVHAGERKAVLRRAAALLGLPPELCALPKRAAQYGTGIHALLAKTKSMK